jgi:anti-sigma B factor antagonist
VPSIAHSLSARDSDAATDPSRNRFHDRGFLNPAAEYSTDRIGDARRICYHPSLTVRAHQFLPGGVMVIEQEMIGPIAVLNLKGPMTAGDDEGRLRDKIRSLVQQGTRRIALDLGGVSYMDSAGLGELMAVHTTVNRGAGQIRVFNITNRVSDLLNITRLWTVLDAFDSKDAALKSLASPSSE